RPRVEVHRPCHRAPAVPPPLSAPDPYPKCQRCLDCTSLSYLAFATCPISSLPLPVRRTIDVGLPSLPLSLPTLLFALSSLLTPSTLLCPLPQLTYRTPF